MNANAMLESLNARLSGKVAELGVVEPKTIRDLLTKCEVELSASLIETIGADARQLRYAKFLLFCERADKLIAEFEKKTKKSVTHRHHELLDESQLLNRAVRQVHLNNTLAGYRADFERRAKELQEDKDNLLKSIPMEQQEDYKALVNMLAKRGINPTA